MALSSGIDLAFELSDDDGVDGVAFEISPITLLLVLFIPILVIAGQVPDTDQLDMASLLLVFSRTFGGKEKLIVRLLFQESAGIGSDVHIGLDGNHEIDLVFVLDLPQGQAIQEAPVDQAAPG